MGLVPKTNTYYTIHFLKSLCRSSGCLTVSGKSFPRSLLLKKKSASKPTFFSYGRTTAPENRFINIASIPRMHASYTLFVSLSLSIYISKSYSPIFILIHSTYDNGMHISIYYVQFPHSICTLCEWMNESHSAHSNICAWITWNCYGYSILHRIAISYIYIIIKYRAPTWCL